MPKAEVRVVAMDSFTDLTGQGTCLDGYGLQLYPINGGVFGEIGLREGDELTGVGKRLKLQYFGDCCDGKLDQAAFERVLANPGEYSMQMGQKIWSFSNKYREEVISGIRPAWQAGALINHAPEGFGANCTWVVRSGFPVIKMIDNLTLGGFFYFDYEGVRRNGHSLYWKNHTMGLLPQLMPSGADAVCECFCCACRSCCAMTRMATSYGRRHRQ